jgi:hypothetical protein
MESVAAMKKKCMQPSGKFKGCNAQLHPLQYYKVHHLLTCHGNLFKIILLGLCNTGAVSKNAKNNPFVYTVKGN